MRLLVSVVVLLIALSEVISDKKGKGEKEEAAEDEDAEAAEDKAEGEGEGSSTGELDVGALISSAMDNFNVSKADVEGAINHVSKFFGKGPAS